MARTKFTKEQGYRPIDLLQAAIDHLFAANVLFSAGDFFSAIGILDVDTEAPRCLDSAGYLSHLGIELVLKAFLLYRTGEFRDAHSLTALTSALKANGLELRIDKTQEPRSSDWMNFIGFAIQIRRVRQRLEGSIFLLSAHCSRRWWTSYHLS